jgi:hypothetical protein
MWIGDSNSISLLLLLLLLLCSTFHSSGSARRSTPKATQHLLPLSYLCDFDPQLLDGGNIKYQHG